MWYRRTHLYVLAAASLAFACGDNHPTSPSLSSVGSGEAAVSSNSKRPGARITGVINETIAGNTIEAVVRITRLTQGADGGLLASGVITGTANGVNFVQEFSNVPATLGDVGVASAAAAGPGIQQVATCDILFLDLGPLNLDVLGLVVNLSQIVLNIDAQAGAGNLLGNLLCAIVGLLDGPGLFTAVANLLNQINAILAAF